MENYCPICSQPVFNGTLPHVCVMSRYDPCPTCTSLRADLARKTAECTAFFDDGVTKGLRIKQLEVGYDELRTVCNRQVSRLAASEARVSAFTQAIGLMTTIKGSMVMRPDDPIGMAQEVAAYCAALEKAVEAAEIICDPEAAGRTMHESWMKTKREQGFHHPREKHLYPDVGSPFGVKTNLCCEKCHLDFIPWEKLPEAQKDINRHAFDALLSNLRAALDAVSSEKKDG